MGTLSTRVREPGSAIQVMNTSSFLFRTIHRLRVLCCGTAPMRRLSGMREMHI